MNSFDPWHVVPELNTVMKYIMDNGEHWFHTLEQLLILQQWTEENI